MPVSDELLEEIRHLIEEYQQKIAEGTRDPSNFMKMDEIETLLGNLCKSTENLYLKDTISMLNSIDERELIASKKENTSPKESN